jgi:hypothetical protein
MTEPRPDDDDELDDDVKNDPVPEPAEPEPEDDAGVTDEPPTEGAT